MAEYSFLTGQTVTIVKEISWTLTIKPGTAHYVPPHIPGNLTFTGKAYIGGQEATGSGFFRRTEVYNVRCYINGSTLRYVLEVVPASTVVDSAGLAQGTPTDSTYRDTGNDFFKFIPGVLARCGGLPQYTPEANIVYDKASSEVQIDYQYKFTLNGVNISIPVHDISASGLGCSASLSSVYCVTTPENSNGNSIEVYSERFNAQATTGAFPNYGLSQPAGVQTYFPRWDINLAIANKYLRGGTIPTSEFSTTVGVLYDASDTSSQPSIRGALSPAEAGGATFASGFDVARVVVNGPSNQTKTDFTRWINGQDNNGMGNLWYGYTYNIEPAGKKFAPSIQNVRLNITQVQPGITVRQNLLNLQTGYSVTLTTPSSTVLEGSWTQTGTGINWHPSDAYMVCGYRWIVATITSTGGATVQMGTQTKTIPPGGSADFLALDRFGDGACTNRINTTPASLGDPSFGASVLSGTVTGMVVSGTHIKPATSAATSNISGAAIYFSRTTARPTAAASDGAPHTLGTLTIFSGGCPGFRADDMPLAAALDYFAANRGTGMTLTLASGSRTPAANSREAAFWNNGLNLGNINNALPFFNASGSSMTLPVAPIIANLIFPKYCGDVITGGAPGPVTTINWASYNPDACFVTLVDGQNDSYSVNIRDNTTAATVRATGSAAADSFGFMIDDAQMPFFKALVAGNVEVVDVDNPNNELTTLSSIRANGAYVPPATTPR